MVTSNRAHPAPVVIERTKVFEQGGDHNYDPDDFSRQTTNDLPVTNMYAYAPTQIA